MGYLNSSHILKFAEGRKIKSITKDVGDGFRILFSNGESLRLYTCMEHGRLNIIATPYRKDGTIKMATDILKD